MAYTITRMKPGDQYESWTLEAYFPSQRKLGQDRKRPYWRARCVCGTVGVLNAEKVLSGEAKASCGCLPKPIRAKPLPKDETKRVRWIFDWAATASVPATDGGQQG